MCVIKLRKMLYGLKNSAMAWSEHINSWMHNHEYDNIDGDGVTFVKNDTRPGGGSSRIIIGLHVDDSVVMVCGQCADVRATNHRTKVRF
jgi:hypothetical protein